MRLVTLAHHMRESKGTSRRCQNRINSKVFHVVVLFWPLLFWANPLSATLPARNNSNASLRCRPCQCPELLVPFLLPACRPNLGPASINAPEAEGHAYYATRFSYQQPLLCCDPTLAWLSLCCFRLHSILSLDATHTGSPYTFGFPRIGPQQAGTGT